MKACDVAVDRRRQWVNGSIDRSLHGGGCSGDEAPGNERLVHRWVSIYIVCIVFFILYLSIDQEKDKGSGKYGRIQCRSDCSTGSVCLLCVCGWQSSPCGVDVY